MAIHKIPQYRYALFKPWDKEAFALVKKIAKTKKYSKIISTKEEKNQFLIMLIRTQKALHGWRKFLVDTPDQVRKSNSINTRLLNKKYPLEIVKKCSYMGLHTKKTELCLILLISLQPKN